jgi:hypothetical protein
MKSLDKDISLNELKSTSTVATTDTAGTSSKSGEPIRHDFAMIVSQFITET